MKYTGKTNSVMQEDLLYEKSGISIFNADSRTKLLEFPDNLFQSCVTSPPYWGLRDYDHPNQIGSEAILDDYIDDLVKVFRQVRRVLKEDGTLWLNLGDSYTSGGRTWRAPDRKNPGRAMSYRPETPAGLKPKDLIGLPWKLAFALQADGWYLRSDIIWNKPNCQPESVKDRFTRSHEYIFLLSKSEKYLFNQKEIMESTLDGVGKKNRRSVWNIKTEGFKGAHFAVFPSALVEICVQAGSSPGQLILDPFFGSGTVGSVSKYLNRRCVGIEMNPEYAEMSIKRIDDLLLQDCLL